MLKKRGAQQSKSVASIGRSKDDNNMLEALKLYESKNYKKSLKLLDTILKKNGNHVDSLILKGLNLQFCATEAEAEAYITKAISKIDGTIASPIGCHLLGIYYRQVKQYKDAVKWFKASLANGSTNTQIYRDLATLQSQTHDFKGTLESRKAYWENFMGYRANWTSLAVAHDLNGQTQDAINVLSKFEELAAGKLGEAEMYEHSECLMYKNDLLNKKAGSDKEALNVVLDDLEKIEKDIYDKYGWLERKASVLMKLGESKKASQIYRKLIQRNPDNFRYYRLLEVSLGIQTNNKLRKALYEKLAKFYPKSEPPKFIPLTFIKDHDELENKLREYITSQLGRGVPATFSNIKPLYKKKHISTLVESIVLAYHESLSATDQPIQYVWTTYFLSLHYLNLKQFQLANEYADKALQHTPTLVELTILKARVLKHLGLLEEAAETIDNGRKLDLQDRFINAKTVKYMLRADRIDDAQQIVSLFTKNDSSVNGVLDLHLLEASWFIIEQAESYHRCYIKSLKKLQALNSIDVSGFDETEVSEQEKSLREIQYNVKKYEGLSLKRFMAIPKIYRQFDDDQLDFHSYCMRKGTPRAYLEMLKWGNQLFTLPMFLRAMEGASKIIFDLDDALRNPVTEQLDDASAKKKANKKAKKEAAALNKQKEEEKSSVLAYAGDEDPFGESLVDNSDPLNLLYKEFLESYLSQVDDHTRRYFVEFDYYLRTGKLALALGVLNKYVKRYGKNSVSGALAFVLFENTSDSYPHDEIAKKVALKGLEKDFAEILKEAEDKLEILTRVYGTSLKSLLILFHHPSSLIQQESLKTAIINILREEDPVVQNQVLQYEFR